MKLVVPVNSIYMETSGKSVTMEPLTEKGSSLGDYSSLKPLCSQEGDPWKWEDADTQD